MYINLWERIGTANNGRSIIWDAFDKQSKRVYNVTGDYDSPPVGFGGYRSFRSMVKLRGLVLDPGSEHLLELRGA